MILDRLMFLEENMRTTIEEVLEEAELILEGEDPKRSASAIVSIMKEMLKTMDGELFAEGDSETEEVIEESTEILFAGFPPLKSGLKTLFKIGQFVKLKKDRCPCIASELLFKDAGLDKEWKDKFGSDEGRIEVKNGQLVFKFLFGRDIIYILLSEGKFYFIYENSIEM